MFTERERSTSEHMMKNLSTALLKGKALPILDTEEAVLPTGCCNASTKPDENMIIETRNLSVEDITLTSNTSNLRSLESNIKQHKCKASLKNRCSKCEKFLCYCGLKWKEGATLFPDFFPRTFYDDTSINTDWFSLSNPSQQETMQTKRNPCKRISQQTDVKLISSWMKYFGQKDNVF